jgi:NAD(P)-dependent dehydrogenase (short-subunit alcohol dehydrogenase family)
MSEPVDPHHLLLIGAGPGVGAGVARRFGREGFRSTLISRGDTEVAAELRSAGLEIDAIEANIEDLDGYRKTLEQIFSAGGAPGVVVYNAALPDPGEILDTTVERLRTAHDVDVIGAVVAAQLAVPVLKAAGGGTLLVTSGGFADNPVPALASLSMGKAALRSAQTLVAAAVREARHPRRDCHDRRCRQARDGLRSRHHRGAFLDRAHRLEGRVADRVPVHRRTARMTDTATR